jgi:agmatinase
LRYELQGFEDIEHDRQVGFEMVTTDDIDDLGIPEIVRRIRKRVGETPVYLRYSVRIGIHEN